MSDTSAASAAPAVYQTACALCGQDIEGCGTEWRDRGNGRQCLPYIEGGEVVHPPEGQHHEPSEDYPAAGDCRYCGRSDHVGACGARGDDGPCEIIGGPADPWPRHPLGSVADELRILSDSEDGPSYVATLQVWATVEVRNGRPVAVTLDDLDAEWLDRVDVGNGPRRAEPMEDDGSDGFGTDEAAAAEHLAALRVEGVPIGWAQPQR